MALRGIIGCEEELYESSSPQFLAVYGRRRIGKTFLISEFFRDKGIWFEVAGIKDTDLKTQLGNFAREFADVFQPGKRIPVPTDWPIGRLAGRPGDQLLPQFGNKKKADIYLLTDEFTLFYLKWVRGWENELTGLEGYWQRQSDSQSFHAWAGNAFETLCIKLQRAVADDGHDAL